MKEIPLTKGNVALVDDEDFEWLSQWKWSFHKDHKGGYAFRNIYLGRSLDEQDIFHSSFKWISMARLLLEAPGDMFVDHINRNTLDNRRGNLRLVTRNENAWNRGSNRNSSSIYKGVGWHKRLHKWQAKISCFGKRIHIGTFDNGEDAARAYDEKARELHGKYAYLNFPD